MWGNAMNAQVNSRLLGTTRFDSGALGLLAMVLHPFRAPGTYRAAISQKGHAAATVSFVVDEKSEQMQLDIDLAQTIQTAKARPGDCACAPEKLAPAVVSPKGYVLFHASSGDGYSVAVSDQGGKVVFDSTKLGDGDLFALSLMEPAVYSMANTLGSGGGEIHVSLPTQNVKIKALETRYVDVTQKGFEPARVEITSTQGLVFRVKSPARIVIEKKSAAQEEGGKPAVRWRKLPVSKKG